MKVYGTKTLSIVDRLAATLEMRGVKKINTYRYPHTYRYLFVPIELFS